MVCQEEICPQSSRFQQNIVLNDNILTYYPLPLMAIPILTYILFINTYMCTYVYDIQNIILLPFIIKTNKSQSGPFILGSFSLSLPKCTFYILRHFFFFPKQIQLKRGYHSPLSVALSRIQTCRGPVPYGEPIAEDRLYGCLRMF